ncbi:unnamed protein product [Adineta steineri]|uniref:NADH dehydrogenase [ubiquinone] 1 alpha subcomplex subunit 9, mitochondrial n=1 Tax=Adineta steineri TaxID=433720 RepID=A0A820AIL7_9BILA|nr:unnamed protein product [Adineta steineri]
MSKILITGGTGVLGRAISEIFLSNQTNFIVGSRNQNTKTYNNMNFNSNLNSKWVYLDLLKNEGFNKCLNDDIDTILHIATVNMQKINGQPVVGINKIPFSYYKGKLECEHLIKTSSIPYTILRSTNFHDFVDAAVSEFLQRPIRIIPKSLKAQPIQVEAVAMELNKIIQGSPLNTTYDIGGKSVYNMKEILDSLMKAHHENKLVINMPAMGKILKGFAKGYNTCNNIQLSSNTWEEYLSKKYHQ